MNTTQEPTTDRLVSVNEAATILNAPNRTVIRWVKEGRLGHVVKLPGATGAYVLSEADVHAFKTTRDTPST